MPQDAFTLRLNAAELNAALSGGRINKVNQPEKDEVSLLIYTGKNTVKLILNANASDCGVYFCDDEKDNPLVAPNFCMLLRKHLQGAEITGVSLVGFERILALRFRCVSDFTQAERTLYAEIMGKYSNLVLTENGMILGALKTTSVDENCKRIIFSGAKYTLPAPQDKVNPQDVDALKALFQTKPEGDTARFLFERVAGLAPCTAEQIVKSYRGGGFAEHVYNYIFSDEISPRVVACEEKPVDFFARAEEGKAFATLSGAQSYFYAQRRALKAREASKRKIDAAINAADKKAQKRLLQIFEKQRECENCEENRIKGELLTANLYRLERGAKGCELDNYYDGTRMKIALDARLSPSDNAQKYYAKYRKQKRTLDALAPQEAEARSEAEYLQSLRAALACAADGEDLRSLEEELTEAGLLKTPSVKTKKKKDEISFRTFEAGGFRIYAGRNNLQNDRLIKRGKTDDMWLHAQKYHSSHVLIVTEGRRVPDEVLLFAANICAKYSAAKGDRIPVDYCALKYVKKPPKSKPGFVIYTDFKTVLTE